MALLLAVTVLACSCAKTASKPGETAVNETTGAAAAETAADANETDSEQELESPEEIAETVSEYDLYKEFDGIIWGFMSGVGAWETMMEIKPDGTFTGEFYDMNMGETGEGYDNGTIYECRFSGMLSAPEEKDDKTYTAKAVKVEYDRSDFDGKDSYIDAEGIKHIASDSYGIGEGDEIIIYAPETRLNETTEDFQQWVYWEFYGQPENIEIGQYGIYNETAETAFFPDHYAMGDAEEFYADNTPESDLYVRAKNAYENQLIPDELQLVCLPVVQNYVSEQYDSVTIKNLQGSWKNEYDEGGDHCIEILQVNGERASISSYRNGELTYGWNGDGAFSIEDRSDRNLCPAIRINDFTDDSNICTIYVRWVKDDSFYDGGFLNEWKRIDTDADSYLIDTVTMDNLQGVWYSEYVDSAGFYQDVLKIEGDQGTLIETIDGKVSSLWNKKGEAWLVSETIYPGKIYPELLLKDYEGNGTAGIYISSVVPDYCFFDQGFARYWYKVPKDIEPYWGPQD